MLAAVEERVSPEYLRYVVEASCVDRLEPARIQGRGHAGGAPRLGLRRAGAARPGLADVVEEPVPVDAWRFRGGWVEAGGTRYDAVSMGGGPGALARGVAGELVRRRSRRAPGAGLLDVAGRVVLVRTGAKRERLWPYHFGLEARPPRRGGGRHVLRPGRPVVPGDARARALRAMRTGRHRRSRSWAGRRGSASSGTREKRVRGGHPRPPRPGTRRQRRRIPAGRGRGSPLIVGGHHDGWFDAAFDDATGVAVTLALARAFVEANLRPRHPIAFVSHTAEEYGVAWSRFDWCYGAWYQITETRRSWSSRAPFYLNVEGSGLPYALRADAPPELAGFVRGILRRAARDGLLPHGFRLAEPNTFTEVWTFLAAGVPGINVSSFAEPWYRADYHTQYDTIERLDFAYLAGLTRVFARILLAADADPDGILAYDSARATSAAGSSRARRRAVRVLSSSGRSPACGGCAAGRPSPPSDGAFTASTPREARRIRTCRLSTTSWRSSTRLRRSGQAGRPRRRATRPASVSTGSAPICRPRRSRSSSSARAAMPRARAGRGRGARPGPESLGRARLVAGRARRQAVRSVGRAEPAETSRAREAGARPPAGADGCGRRRADTRAAAAAGRRPALRIAMAAGGVSRRRAAAFP